MPIIKRLSNCTIHLRTRDHRPAHVHVVMNDGRDVLVMLHDLQVQSRKPVLHKEIAEALAWIGSCSDQLMIKFEELQS
jgi:hypothetical protein